MVITKNGIFCIFFLQIVLVIINKSLYNRNVLESSDEDSGRVIIAECLIAVIHRRGKSFR
jgi:hypothetical protein